MAGIKTNPQTTSEILLFINFIRNMQKLAIYPKIYHTELIIQNYMIFFKIHTQHSLNKCYKKYVRLRFQQTNKLFIFK